MKIEIKKRKYWKEKCENLISHLKYIQLRDNADFENEWYNTWLNRSPFMRKLLGPITPFPKYYDNPFYPSIFGSLWINKARILLKALNDSNTGIIYIDKDLYDVLSKY